MLLIYWIILLILSIVFIFLGNLFKDATISDVLLVVGWGFMFIVGMIMMIGNIFVPVGNVDEISFEYDVNGLVSRQMINSSTEYADLFDQDGFVGTFANKHVIGFFIAALGMLGSIVFWFDARKDPYKEDEFGSSEGGL